MPSRYNFPQRVIQPVQMDRLNYNCGMEPDYRLEAFSLRSMRVAGFVVIAIMGGVGLFSLKESWAAAAALPLLIGLAILQDLPGRAELAGPRIHLCLAAEVFFIAGLLLLGPNNAAFGFLLFIPAAQAAVFFPLARALPWILLSFLVLASHSLLAWGRSGVANIFFNAGGYVFVIGFGYVVRQAELARRQSQSLLLELQAAQQQLQELAVTEERNRLAREMHDSLGHRLTVAVVQLEGAQRLIPTDPDRAASMIGTMREQLKEALADLRRTVAALRSDELPLQTAVTELAKSFQESTGMQVHLQLPADLPALPNTYRLAMYRAAQEALTNAQRHAAASQVRLEILVEEGCILLTASDDGKGTGGPAGDGSPAGVWADSGQGGFGLRGLRERAEQLGGDVQFEAVPERGAQLKFRLPLPGLLGGKEDGKADPPAHRR